MHCQTLSSQNRKDKDADLPWGIHSMNGQKNGGNKMKIDFTAGVRRPKNPLHTAKLSSEVGMHIRSDKMPLAMHWKLYDKDKSLQEAVPSTIKKVAVSLVSSFILLSCLLHG